MKSFIPPPTSSPPRWFQRWNTCSSSKHFNSTFYRPVADFSCTRLSMALFQQTEKDRKSDKSPNATGSLEISVAD